MTSQPRQHWLVKPRAGSDIVVRDRKQLEPWLDDPSYFVEGPFVLESGRAVVEWRVVLHTHNGRLETNLPDEVEARAYAEEERGDYPHYRVAIERRTVSPWEEV